MEESDVVKLKLQKIKLLEERAKLKEGLPFLYGHKLYKWQLDYKKNRDNKTRLLCAANQIGKSTIQIEDRVDVATNPAEWRRLWPHLYKGGANPKPSSWYLYPNQTTCTSEFDEKWRPSILPKGEFKDHPIYGWKETISNKIITKIDFNSGWTIYFKTYSQSVQDLQAGTVWAIDCFTKGHMVATKRGSVDISEIVNGDMVLTRDGFKPVIRTFSRKQRVITRLFSDGTRLTGTEDHPFIVKDKIIKFSDLTQEDQVGTVPLWRYLWLLNQTKRLCYLKEFFIRAYLTVKTLGKVTITAQQKKSCMLQYGNLTIKEAFHLATLYIIRTLTLSTMGFLILSCSLVESTLGFTRYKSGRQWSTSPLSVLSAELISFRDHLRRMFQDTALRNVEGQKVSLNASAVTKSLRQEATQGECTAQNPVQTEDIVYNIEVSGKHEYYVNGILVHNCDEELPIELYDELQARLFASDGYFSMAFTATRGQTFWKNAIEGRGERETFKDAFKVQISQYDCMKYADGSETPWTIDRIERNKSKCKNNAEVQRRIYGKFMVDSGLLYSGFEESRNVIEYPKLDDGKIFKGVPNGWSIYSGIDYGSGGENNHPSAIVFISASPDYKKIRLFKCKRFDKIQMTAGDLYREYTKERGEMRLTNQAYDWAAADLGTIAARNADSLNKADKSHASGELALNSALKSGILKIYRSEESEKLVDEITSIKEGYDKKHAADDLLDALRYAINSVPIDWVAIMGEAKEETKEVPKDQSERSARPRDYERENIKEYASGCEEEFEFWSELY